MELLGDSYQIQDRAGRDLIATFFCALAMQHIQDAAAPPSQFNPQIPPAQEDIILRCLEKVPEMRYRDGLQLARVLEGLRDA